MIAEYTYLDAVKVFGCYIGTKKIYIYMYRERYNDIYIYKRNIFQVYASA